MMFESLPNEILYEILDFLDVGERFYAFDNINSRFNALIFTQYHTYRINFWSTWKCQSSFLVQQYILSIANRVISLRLSDDYNESPPQTDILFSSGLQLDDFKHLRSLSLCYIDQAPIFREIMIHCHQIPHLTHLKVIKCHAGCMVSVDFSNHIWSLPQLTHCRLDMQDDFCIPTVVSSSIKYLSISCHDWWIRQTASLVQRTPNLQRLHIPLNNLNDDLQVTLPSLLSVTTLKLSQVRSSKVMKILLLAVPNLTYLKVDTFYINSDGYVWEKLLDDHLSKLNAFHLRMRVQFRRANNKQQIDHLVDSFRTRFWLEKHQWYVRSHLQFEQNFSSIFLYTLPYTFTDFDVSMSVVPYRSTCPQDAHYDSYNKVNSLCFDLLLTTNSFSLIHFSNIGNLLVRLPLNDSFYQIVPTLHQLKSLTVLSANQNSSFDLQSLLDRSPCLYSLTIKAWPASEIPLVQNTNASVRRLDLRVCHSWSSDSFISSEGCHTFIRSPLARQCEELLINVKNCESILDLANNMVNLRLLNVQYRVPRAPLLSYREQLGSDSDSNYRSDDVSIKWLQDQLPQTCTIFNFKRHYESIGMHIYFKKA